MQLGLNLHSQTSTETHLISSYSTPFPVFISIVPENVFNISKLKVHGIYKAADYFMGVTEHDNKDFFSWGGKGLDVNGTNVQYNQTFKTTTSTLQKHFMMCVTIQGLETF